MWTWSGPQTPPPPLGSQPGQISPPLVWALLPWNNCKIHWEKAKNSSSAGVPMTSTWAQRLPSQTLPHPSGATSVTVWLPSPLSSLNTFFFALHPERRVCRAWLRQVGLISVWAAELEPLPISDNRGAVPAWTGRASTAALSCTWSFYVRLIPSALAPLKTMTSLCCQVQLLFFYSVKLSFIKWIKSLLSVKVEVIAAGSVFHAPSLSSGVPVCGVSEWTECPHPGLPDGQ